jgi:hypothetical protein
MWIAGLWPADDFDDENDSTWSRTALEASRRAGGASTAIIPSFGNVRRATKSKPRHRFPARGQAVYVRISSGEIA